ncbi:hypothetical protein LXA43DRAFT_233316 [Ganoderma leucocontextum]|nr:hypothetical protein LXA43DRAFT_233316 [Ganoderma leucocontextum]
MPIPTQAQHRSPRPMHTLPHIATQDLQHGSPTTPKFEIERPRRRSLSPIPASPSPAASSSKSVYVPPPLTWRNAAQDALAGICYTRDAFPSSNFLPPPFSREPVIVEAGERVEFLEEFDEYAVRVRVLRTDVVGLIPTWNTEGALERLTRMNTAFNEAATCPVEARALRSRDSESSPGTSWDDAASSPTDGSLTHVHSRCIPFSARVRFPDYYGPASALSDDDDSDSELPQSPPEFERGRPLQARPTVFEAPPQTLEKGGISEEAARSRSGSRKSVNFAAGERPQVVFRYPSADLFLGEEMHAGAGDPGNGNSEEDESEWWWQGWEEVRESLEEQEEADSGEASGATREGETQPKMIDLELFPFAFDEDEL